MTLRDVEDLLRARDLVPRAGSFIFRAGRRYRAKSTYVGELESDEIVYEQSCMYYAYK
jgi:hypothetical protein